MTKRILAILFALILILSVAVLPAHAAESKKYRIDDYAGLLTDDDISKLNKTLDEVSEKCDCNLLFVTANNLSEVSEFYKTNTAEDFAKSYYNSVYGKNEDGIVVFLCLSDQDGDRNLSIYGTGKCEKRLSNSESEDIRDDAIKILKNKSDPQSKDYYEFFNSIALGIKKAVPPHVTALQTIIAIVVGFAISLVIMLILKSRLKTVRPERGAVNYVRPGSMNVTASRDTYLYRTVSRTAKPKNNSSSSSSSGGSFSGGSSKF